MSVKTYSLKKDGSKKLAPNFEVREFASPGNDTVKIDTDLVSALQSIRNLPNVDSVIIISGFRTVAHNKKIGGASNSSHLYGKAADFQAKDKKGKIIPSKYICCYLQDKGYIAIEQINSTNVHIDKNFRYKKWWAYKKGTSYPTVSSFYQYNKCTRAEVNKALGITVFKVKVIKDIKYVRNKPSMLGTHVKGKNDKKLSIPKGAIKEINKTIGGWHRLISGERYIPAYKCKIL